jgi:hypothetical protein
MIVRRKMMNKKKISLIGLKLKKIRKKVKNKNYKYKLNNLMNNFLKLLKG